MNDRKQIREAFRNMPKGKPTPAETQADIVYAVLDQGVPVKQVAADMGMSQQTVYKIVNRHKLAREHGAERGDEMTEKVLAGNKEDGKFVCTAMDVYEGTCRRADGKMARKAFRQMGMREAMAEWEDWCAKLRELDRKKAEESKSPEPTSQDVSGLFPVRSDEPTADVLARLGAVNADRVTMDAASWACLLAFVEARCAKAAPAEVPCLPDEMYVTWMDGRGPHAIFSDMEEATRTVDTLNSALEFAGVDGRYEVMDVKPWRM